MGGRPQRRGNDPARDFTGSPVCLTRECHDHVTEIVSDDPVVLFANQRSKADVELKEQLPREQVCMAAVLEMDPAVDLSGGPTPSTPMPEPGAFTGPRARQRTLQSLGDDRVVHREDVVVVLHFVCEAAVSEEAAKGRKGRGSRRPRWL